ncbi:helix-turn-helix domain-containing protein [Paractinoplanes rishiriensis]|uniref:Helix-turn-helix domain-containing protein n=1 Tax=Paractinoplanes rishiriensis TaxID=1050105 RepID=A0A919K3V3_9ACTN|nr:helix-turn-helix domain-containing protein [Actinoplanes rishiriensis]GIF00412.1 hypothetical protein Ari01nite_78760 [Actinoplanes rishiriensis]
MYVRQSTVAQVRFNTESTQRQYGLVGTAAEFGWSVKQAAAELGIPADAVYNWLRHGQVPARRGPSGRWCIPWDPATREIYQEKVARSFRLKPMPSA